jgi:hypothetical protein
MRLLNIQRIVGFVLTSLLIVAGGAVAESQSAFTTYNLKHGITIKIPKHWQILNKQITDTLGASTEAMTGNEQGNADIVIAANYYEDDSGIVAASANVTVKIGKTASQNNIKSMTQSALDVEADKAYKAVRPIIEKSGDGKTRISRIKMVKEGISGYIAIRTDYQQIRTDRTLNVVSYNIYLGDKLIKATLTCDAAQKNLLEPTINAIKKSIKIRI